MTELEMSAAVESALRDEWQCQMCLLWQPEHPSKYSGRPGHGGHWGPWCRSCWGAWASRDEYNGKVSLAKERAIFQQKMRHLESYDRT